MIVREGNIHVNHVAFTIRIGAIAADIIAI